MTVIIRSFLLLAIGITAATAGERVNTTFFGDKAIEGYDAVAYFTQAKPVKGNSDYVVEWRGANWRFATAENKAKFEANPEKYAPQYGGYCAFAVAKGDRVGIDPEAWSIVDGKLYLNYNQKIQRQWEADQANFITKANQQWPEIGFK